MNDLAQEYREAKWEGIGAFDQWVAEIGGGLRTIDEPRDQLHSAALLERLAKMAYVEWDDRPLSTRLLVTAADILNTPITTVGEWYKEHHPDLLPVVGMEDLTQHLPRR